MPMDRMQQDKPMAPMDGKAINPMPTGQQRLDALRHLGVTFREGDHDVVKIATPSIQQQNDDPIIPTFVEQPKMCSHK
ncbi:hypothetical protein BC940DRAFT_332730 [Gongronella butleri]|nr:hypothetical protein BC940DRAFT_332730 [Gongronella butleri]